MRIRQNLHELFGKLLLRSTVRPIADHIVHLVGIALQVAEFFRGTFRINQILERLDGWIVRVLDRPSGAGGVAVELEILAIDAGARLRRSTCWSRCECPRF
jgi:hypothetical protein